jgi:hypothetical protein
MKTGTYSDDMQTVKKLIHNMDWKLLKAQKIVLSKLQSKRSLLPSEHETIEGVLCLFDAIQDTAVDTYGYDNNEVFNHGNMTLREAKEIAVKGTSKEN